MTPHARRMFGVDGSHNGDLIGVARLGAVHLRARDYVPGDHGERDQNRHRKTSKHRTDS
ncbi:MAG: hypothetical protein JXP72_10885 [Coriobacteriia bacterium]|nr:hypothetical protein [Coriobacteriia bacterium]